MNLPALPSFRAESFPGAPSWLTQLLLMLNQALRPLQSAIQRVPERTELADKFFTTESDGKATVELKTAFPPRGFSISRGPTPESGELLESVWSFSWQRIGEGKVRVRFVGLAADTKHTFSAVYD